MSEYVKIPLNFKDKILVLFFGLIKKKYIVIENRVIQGVPEPKEKPKGQENTITEEKLDIPFFDLDNSEAKSNL